MSQDKMKARFQLYIFKVCIYIIENVWENLDQIVNEVSLEGLLREEENFHYLFSTIL